MVEEYHATALKVWTPHNELERYGNVVGQGQNAKDKYLRSCEFEAEMVGLCLPAPARYIILDYGAGPGQTARSITAKGHSVYALDVCPDMLADYPDPYRLITDGQTIPLLDHSVDFVYSFLCFQHIPLAVVSKVADEVRRVLKPTGGYLIQFSQFGTHDWPGQCFGQTVKYSHQQVLDLLPDADVDTWKDTEGRWDTNEYWFAYRPIT